jgi:hypothetical protein
MVSDFPAPGRRVVPRLPESHVVNMSLVASAMTAQSSNLQTNITMQLMKNNATAEKQAMQVLLGIPGASSQASLGTGVGGQVDVSA